MKIIISARGTELDGPFDARFGRAANFVLFDTQDQQVQGLTNPAMGSGGGAGVQAAQFLVGQGADVVISGRFGPHAYQALAAAGVKLIAAPNSEGQSVRAVLEEYQAGRLTEVTQPGQPGHRQGRRHQAKRAG